MVRTPSHTPPRPGVILLVVVILLTLFMVVGISFVLYAESEATASRIYREAQAPADPPLPSELLLSWALGQLIYDVPDDAANPNNPGEVGDPTGFTPYSAMRGHSLARTMYGWNWTVRSQTPNVPNDAFDMTRPLKASNLYNNNVTAYNGRGVTDQTSGVVTGVSLTDASFPNYQYFNGDGLIRDPERNGSRQFPWSSFILATSYYVGGFNPPYTYPDRNNMFLAAVNANGQMLVPSFYRPWLSTLLPLDPAAPGYSNWSDTTASPAMKYMTLRPRPADMYINPSDPTQSFPPPGKGGDVKNLVGAQGGNDSIWMDLGFPVQTTNTGRKYKPLFAFLIVDLDNRVNINVHGNIRGIDPQDPSQKVFGHASNMGLGKHEINLAKIFAPPTGDPLPATHPAEWTQLLTGNLSPINTFVGGRYGDPFGNPPNQTPPAYPQPGDRTIQPINVANPPSSSPALTGRASYLFPLDYDAVNETATTGAPWNSAQRTTRFQLPQGGWCMSFPYFQATPSPGVNAPASPGYGNASQQERLHNPFLYNVLLPQNDAPHAIDNMYYLMGEYQSQAKTYQRSSIYVNDQGQKNLQKSLDDTFPVAPTNSPRGARIRQLITTHSFDLDVPGAMPWVTTTDPKDPSNPPSPYEWLAPGSSTPPFPTGRTGTLFLDKPATFSPTGDFALNPYMPSSPGVPNYERRAAILSRADLNRKLTSYYDPNNNNAFNPATYAQAVADRQQFAKDIFDRLRLAVGARAPADQATIPPGQPEHDAQRWLAQLAVNIVDYIDDDDFSTPFSWNPLDPTQIVYGVEAPKVVLNEAYAEIENDPADTDPAQGATKPYQVSFWLELLNPMNKSSVTNLTDPDLGADRASAQLYRQDAGGRYPIYKVVIAPQTPATNGITPTILTDRKNTNGDIPTANQVIAADLTATNNQLDPALDPTLASLVLPSNGRFSKQSPTPSFSNDGFYVLGPERDFVDGDGSFVPTVKIHDQGAASKNKLTYVYGNAPTASVPSGAQLPHIIALQRLACPMMRENPINPTTGQPVNPALPANPFITVDYLTNVPTNDAVKLIPNQTPGDPAGSKNPTNQPLARRQSFARLQPYAASLDRLTTRSTPPTGQPQATFFQQNVDAPATTPAPASLVFDWLVHLDRSLVSPLELAYVSMTPPHQLTQQFIQGTVAAGGPPTISRKFGHLAPWVPSPATVSGATPSPGYAATDVQNARLYRALEYFTAGDRWLPSATSCRVPGMININTIWDQETFLALCDGALTATSIPTPVPPAIAPTDGHFNEDHVKAAWQQIVTLRTPGILPGTPTPTLSQTDSPFWSLANAASIGGGVERTLLRSTNPSGASSPVFQAPATVTPPVGQHPYLLNEILSKIGSHVTTRSNVFAVYITVGFFRVMQDTDTAGNPIVPVKLGSEIGAGDGSDVAKNFRRRRMFAIVDRTNLALDNDRTVTPSQPDTTFNLRQPYDPNFPGLSKPYHIYSSVGVPPPQTAGQPVQVDVPVPAGTFDNLSKSLVVQYQSDTFNIFPQSGPNPGTRLWADTGTQQEQVQVVSIQPPNPNPQVGDYYYKLRIQFTNSHPAGFRLSNYRLGNPGPQGPIDYTSPQYSAVVPYTFIIE
jgi:hypothetical protein